MEDLIIALEEIKGAFTSELSVWWILAPIFLLWFAVNIAKNINNYK